MNVQIPPSENWEVGEGNFYDRAYPRIVRAMFVVAVLATAVLLAVGDWRTAAGFLVGCAVALLNFHWLKRVVSVLADKSTASGRPQSSSGVVVRFLLRYLLMALAAYVIFRVSLASLYGLLAGLFLPVAGIMAEAGYELYATLRRRA